MTLAFSLLFAIIVIALLFDVINGFHDAANSIATIVSTRVLKPHLAVLWMAFFNFFAMFIFAPKVAETISKIINIETNDPHYILVIFAGLLAAIVWDLLTWRLGLPTSSSHALIGGLSGAGVALGGVDALRWDVIFKTIIFIVLSPFIGFFLGAFFMLCCSWIFKKCLPSTVEMLFRKGQLLSAALYSIGHGANDAQKTMGVILALLIASGLLEPSTELSLTDPLTLWIILACHLAMALGTLLGGWRIVKTMGMKITKLKPIGGFCAESAGALTLAFATQAGVPVSTTHAIVSAIIGVGTMTTRFSKIKWGIASRIVWSWLLTLPASALLGAICAMALF